MIIDLNKAFDTVKHAILLKKSTALGVDSNSLLLFKSYLRKSRGFRAFFP